MKKCQYCDAFNAMQMEPTEAAAEELKTTESRAVQACDTTLKLTPLRNIACNMAPLHATTAVVLGQGSTGQRRRQHEQSSKVCCS